MRDIGYLDNRIENLERVTSLSFLEVQTQTLQVQDADGKIDLRVVSLLMILETIL